MTDPDSAPELDAETIVATLNKFGVKYVVIGAFAAQLQGAPIPRTRDIDVTPATDAANLKRLSGALHELQARIRTVGLPEGLPFDHDGPSLGRARMWNLTSPFGEFDIAFVPSGTDGYDDLVRQALIVESHGAFVPVANLDDVIRSKEAAGRPKDIVQLPLLIQTARRRRIEREGHDRGLDIDL
jgi:hypothetical protein